VLCPVDFSEDSRLALQYAQTVALRGKATLTAVYANDPLLVAAAAAALHNRDLVKKSAIELQAFLDGALTGATRRRLGVTSRVSIGDPAGEIVKMAARSRADLIVMGTRGLTGAEGLLLGSTTRNVLRRATIPVLAIPLAQRSPTGGGGAWPGQPIVAAIDLDADPERQVRVASAIAEWFGSSLLLLHIVTGIGAPAWMKAELSAHERIRIAEAERRLDALVALARRRVTADGRVMCGRVSDEIAALAAGERIGLVVTALSDKPGWFASTRGAVSSHVLAHAVTPVLAWPPNWRPR
jgi:nucleotide-binding universal stress UspA family protein